MSKRNTIDYVCYNNKCKNNENGFCQLKGIKPGSCVNGITKQGYELGIEWRDQKIQHLEMVLECQYKKVTELNKDRKEYKELLCNLLSSAIAYEVFTSGELTEKQINTAIDKVRHNKYDFKL
jgi:hypothetical protein